MAIAVRSGQYRLHLQNALEETQRQAEELQVQSEELRVSNEELEEQSRALPESQARLEQQQIELEQTNAQLEEQTQLLEAQRDDLAKARVEVEAKAPEVQRESRYKSDFLANMSHELRTPLNSSLILARHLADDKQNEIFQAFRQIDSAANRKFSGTGLGLSISQELARPPGGEWRGQWRQFARSSHPGDVNLLAVDGSVRFVPDDVDENVWKSLATPNGEENFGSL
jgi:signal transduction histidine kinase